MKRPLVLALAAAATLFGATAANAARVDWSIGINLPPIGAVVGPGYAGYPAYRATGRVRTSRRCRAGAGVRCRAPVAYAAAAAASGCRRCRARLVRP